MVMVRNVGILLIIFTLEVLESNIRCKNKLKGIGNQFGNVSILMITKIKKNLNKAYNTLYKFDRNSTGGEIMFYVSECI